LTDRCNAWAEQFEIIGEVRGLGPMMALELVKDRKTKEPAADEARALVERCLGKGLVVLSCGTLGNVMRLLMPLVIEDEQLEKGLSILEEELSKISKK
jgi:4-aminobutyrate aminotransferase/(S)-3-amino-2-methylpropionate transaminase